MKLYEKNGKLYFDYEHAEKDIFKRQNYHFNSDYGFEYKGKGIREFSTYGIDVGWAYAHEQLWETLNAALELFNANGVILTPSAQKYIAEFKAKAEAEKAEHEAYKAKQRALIKSASAKAEWAKKQKNGCSAYPCCPNLFYDLDAPKCKCGGNPIDKRIGTDPKNIYSCFYDGVHNLFVSKAFPGDTCPLRTDEPMTKEEEQALKHSWR